MSKRLAEETDTENSKRQTTEVVLLDTPDNVLALLPPYIARAREVCRRWRDSLQGHFLDNLRLKRDHYLKLGLSALRNRPTRPEAYSDLLDEGIAYTVTVCDIERNGVSSDTTETVLSTMQRAWWPFVDSKASLPFPNHTVKWFLSKSSRNYGAIWSSLSLGLKVPKPSSLLTLLARVSRLPLTWNRIEAMIEHGLAHDYISIKPIDIKLLAIYAVPFKIIDSLDGSRTSVDGVSLGWMAPGDFRDFYPAYLEEAKSRGYLTTKLISAIRFQADSVISWEALVWVLEKLPTGLERQEALKALGHGFYNDSSGVSKSLLSPERLEIANQLFEKFFGRFLERIPNDHQFILSLFTQSSFLFTRPVLRLACKQCSCISEWTALLSSVDPRADLIRAVLEASAVVRDRLVLAYVMDGMGFIVCHSRANNLLDAVPELESSDVWPTVERFLKSLHPLSGGIAGDIYVKR